MATKVNGNGLHPGTNGHSMAETTAEDIMGLSDYSSRLERVLLALMRQQEVMEKAIQADRDDRERSEKEIKDKIASDGKHFQDLLKKERDDRKNMNDKILGDFTEKLDSGNGDIEELKLKLEEEKHKREAAVKDLSDGLGGDIAKCNKTTAQLEAILQGENEKRRKEAEELSERIEREKLELQEYIDADNQKLREKLDRESAQMKEKLDNEAKALKDKLEQESEMNRVASEKLKKKLEEDGKGILERISNESKELKENMESQGKQMLDTMNNENDARKQEADEINRRMEQEKEELKAYMENDSKNLKEKLEKEKEDLRRKMEADAERLQKKLEQENKERSKNSEDLKATLDAERKRMEDKLMKEQNELQKKMDEEAKAREAKEREAEQKLEKTRDSGRNETIELFKKVRKDLDDCRRENEELRNMMKAEKEKREKETDAVKEKIEKEKQELRESMEKDLTKENAARKQDSTDLRALLDREKENLFLDFSRGTSQVREQVDRDTKELAGRLEEQRRDAEEVRRDLAQKMGRDGQQLTMLAESVNQLMRAAQTPGQYFCAVREEPYSTGGEEYLTFHRCTATMGGGMDPKSGVFTAVVPGCYLFCLTVCSQDMKKVLVAIRRNGEEVGTVYDQNHIDNHRNSMAGQSLLVELEHGDRVQVYVYTFTGLHDKGANHLTQFLGFLLRPSVPAIQHIED